MNLPNLVPVFAKPHEGSSIRRLSSAFQTLSVCLFFIVTSGRARDHVAWQRAIAHTVCRFHSSSNVGSANSSAHRPTAEAPTPVVSFQLPCNTAIWMAKLPKVVDSGEPSNTSSPVLSGVDDLRGCLLSVGEARTLC